MKNLLFLFLLNLITITTSLAQSFTVGQKVEGYDTGWYKATVKEVGTGEHLGYCLLDYDDYGTDRWHQNKNIRPLKTVKEPSYVAGPRLGKYSILSYFSANPIRLGHFTLLKNNKYSFFNNGGGLIGSGTYSYNKGEKHIKWLTGPLSKNGWKGDFSITREEKTHSITLKRGTVGTNSLD